MSKAVCEYPARFEDPGEVRPVMAAALVAWTSRDVSKTGVMGDAPSATAEKGERWLDQMATAYAASIAQICSEGKA
jgi:creatinine amidohydrolase